MAGGEIRMGLILNSRFSCFRIRSLKLFEKLLLATKINQMLNLQREKQAEVGFVK